MDGTTRLYIARHGETDWNAAARWQGQTDVPLNAAGRAQAEALAERLRGAGIAAIASSDLARARDTASIVASRLGLEVEVDPALREQAYGRFEGLTRGECEARFPAEWARYRADWRDVPDAAEPYEALLARVLEAVRRLSESLSAPALLVMHGGVMRAVLRETLGSIPSPASADWARSGIANCGLFQLTLSRGRVVAAEQLDGTCEGPRTGADRRDRSRPARDG